MKQLIWSPVKAVRLANLDPATADRIGTNIVADYNAWKQQRRGSEEVWREIDRHVNQYDPIYSNQIPSDKGIQLNMPNQFGSKLKMTNVYSHREGLVSSVMKYLMENDYDFFDIVPLDPMDDNKVAAVKEYFMWLFDEMDFESSFVPFCRDVIQYGTAVASYEWCREIMPRWKREYMTDPLTQQAIAIDYEATDVIYDAPKFTPLNLYYTVIDPSARDLRTATLIMKRPVGPHEIMANPDYGKLNWEFVNGAPQFQVDPLETDRDWARRNDTQSGAYVYHDKKEVYEAWGDFTDGPTIYKNYVAETLGGKLIRFEPNPYMMPHKPFVIARYTVETNRIYGHSPLASITGIQAGLDTMVNQYLDYWNMEINRPLLVQANTIVRAAKTDKNSLPPVSKDVAWTVRDVNNCAKRLDWGSRSTSMDPTGMMALLGDQMEKATGDNDLMSGGQPDRYVNTGVAMQAADAGSAKLNMYAKTIEKESIVPMLEMTVDLVRQMNVPPQTFKRKDMPGAELNFDPSLLVNNIKFSMRGASYNMTKQVQVSTLQQFLLALANNPLTAPIINWIKAVKIMGQAMGIRHTDDLITPQAQMVDMQTPQTQLPFMQRVMALLGGQSGAASQAPQMPGPQGPPMPSPQITGQQGNPQSPLEDTPIGNQPTLGSAAAFGGNAPGATTPSPFDNVSQR